MKLTDKTPTDTKSTDTKSTVHEADRHKADRTPGRQDTRPTGHQANRGTGGSLYQVGMCPMGGKDMGGNDVGGGGSPHVPYKVPFNHFRKIKIGRWVR